MEGLVDCYDNNQPHVNMKAGGAGIGCRMILDHCSSFYVSVKKDEESVVCCRLPVGKRMKYLESSHKDLHITVW